MNTQDQTKEPAAPKWEAMGGLLVTTILRGDDFYISYLPPGGLAGLEMFASDGNGAETALCKAGKFYILNGDFRETYERLAPEGFDACLQFFNQQRAHARSSWSEDRP